MGEFKTGQISLISVYRSKIRQSNFKAVYSVHVFVSYLSKGVCILVLYELCQKMCTTKIVVASRQSLRRDIYFKESVELTWFIESISHRSCKSIIAILL